jgi:hypothetical protein
MSVIVATHELRELSRRMSGGLDIRLLWDAQDNSTSIEIRHRTLGTAPLRFDVEPAHALEAFRHPFAHLTNAVGDLPFEWTRNG